MEIQAYNDAVVRDFTIHATPKNSSNYTPEQETANRNDMTEDEWLTHTAFRNKEKGLKDYTSWDVKVIVYVDSGADNVLNPAIPSTTNEGKSHRRMQSNSIKGTLKVTIPSLTRQIFSTNVEIPPNTEMNFTVQMSLTGVTQWMPNKFGTQQLYDFEVNFVNSQSVSDDGKHRGFGFREIASKFFKSSFNCLFIYL